jgi:hypothetical protein
MSLRPPASPSSVPAHQAALTALDAEIMAEQASALGRAGRRLENALADLAGFDAGTLPKRRGRKPAPDRPALLAEARRALWYLVVQREACGVRNTAELLAVYAVPAEVSHGITLPRLTPRRR